jgi:OPA family glycerol-3-phosphate transporter-like MFS transporter
MQPTNPTSRPASQRAYFLLGTLVLAYVGVYLCRKNFAVAVPMLQKSWGLTKEQVGLVGSVSTAAYAVGKVSFGPVTDRIGGRTSLLGAMVLVALFGVAGACAPGLGALAVLYSANRLCGAASWGAMIKQTSQWFAPEKLAFACGLLSLSYVFGGGLAVSFAGLVAKASHDSWRAVLGLPSLVLAVLVAVCWVVLPRRGAVASPARPATPAGPRINQIWRLFGDRKFLVVLGLSFTLTLLRETFNFWTVDFIRTEGGPETSTALAAFLSTPFDLCGAAGIILMGWVFGRLRPGGRQRLLVSLLGLLTVLLVAMPELFSWGPMWLAAGIGLIGFLVYGPYSLLAGVLAVDVGGERFTATVSGWVDGTGYVAGFLSGALFGRLLMAGGYRLGFQVMAAVTLGSAVLCCFLYRRRDRSPHGASVRPPDAPNPSPLDRISA